MKDLGSELLRHEELGVARCVGLFDCARPVERIMASLALLPLVVVAHADGAIFDL